MSHMTHMSHKTTSRHRPPYDQYCGTAVDSAALKVRPGVRAHVASCCC
jgi:hypothetical protein